MSKINDLFDLKGKVIIITGGTGLLGWEYANVLASAGANIVLVDLDNNNCEKKYKELERKFKNRMLGIKADITNKEEVKGMIKEVEKKFGKVDILINNAAFNCPVEDKDNYFVNFEDYPLSLWEKSISVNLTGAFLCTQEAIRLMLKKNNGLIINICSIYGYL